MNTMTESFSSDLTTAIELYFPSKSVKIHHTDKPWMTSSIKQLILDRQRTYYSCHDEQWRHQRNKVRDAIYIKKINISIEGKFNISGLVIHTNGGTTSLSYDDEAGNVISGANLAARLNQFYISVTPDLSSLDTSTLPAFLPAQYELPLIRSWEVCNKLPCLSPFKAIGPDSVPNRI